MPSPNTREYDCGEFCKSALFGPTCMFSPNVPWRRHHCRSKSRRMVRFADTFPVVRMYALSMFAGMTWAISIINRTVRSKQSKRKRLSLVFWRHVQRSSSHVFCSLSSSRTEWVAVLITRCNDLRLVQLYFILPCQVNRFFVTLYGKVYSSWK